MTKATTAEQKGKLHEERADTLEKLIAVCDSDEESANWVRQFADTIALRHKQESMKLGCSACVALRQRWQRFPSFVPTKVTLHFGR